MNDMFEHRRYAIISSGDVALINFDHVLETSAETLRYSLDGTKTFVKYDCVCGCHGEEQQSCTCCPGCITACPSHTALLTISEIHDILSTEEWTSPSGEFV